MDIVDIAEGQIGSQDEEFSFYTKVATARTIDREAYPST